MTSATTSVSAVHVPRLCKNIQEVNEHVYAVLGTHWNRLYPDCLKIIQDMNECVYTVPGTHWNTWYPDCVRNVVNGHGYMVPGTHWNALRRCFQLVPGIFTPAQYIVHWHSRGQRWIVSVDWLYILFIIVTNSVIQQSEIGKCIANTNFCYHHIFKSIVLAVDRQSIVKGDENC